MSLDRAPILHVDMDAFFAAIEQRDHPEWRGKPVIVGSPPDRRGVVATASYEARVFGVRSAMPSRTAGRLCPDGIFVRPRMARYREVSGHLRELLDHYTPFVEPMSIDEAFLDVSGVLHRWGEAADLARDLRARIRGELGLTASVGVAPNKFLAKLASDMHKPDGLTLVPLGAEAVRDFLAPLPLARIPGVGQVAVRRLQALGLHTVGDVQASELEALGRSMGWDRARGLIELAFGRDERAVEVEREAKSISAEHTFGEDCESEERIIETLLAQAEEVGRRLRAAGLRGRRGTLKIRTADFQTRTRQQGLVQATASDRDLCRCAVSLYRRTAEGRAVRLVGFGVSGLVPAGRRIDQPELFEEGPAEGDPGRQERLDEVLDGLRAKYGVDAVRRGRVEPKPPASGKISGGRASGPGPR